MVRCNIKIENGGNTQVRQHWVKELKFQVSDPLSKLEKRENKLVSLADKLGEAWQSNIVKNYGCSRNIMFFGHALAPSGIEGVPPARQLRLKVVTSQGQHGPSGNISSSISSTLCILIWLNNLWYGTSKIFLVNIVTQILLLANLKNSKICQMQFAFHKPMLIITF